MIIIKLFKILRSLFYTNLARLSLHDMNVKIKANGYTLLTKNTRVGNNVHFNGLKVLGNGEVRIGNNFHSGFGCILLTGIHDYYGSKLPYDETIIYKAIEIEDNVWFGINVIILPGVNIGEGSIIQAGSVVVSSIPKYSIAGGHPAKVFGKRDIDHYNKLKEENRYI